jgi:hypothetical protein
MTDTAWVLVDPKGEPWWPIGIVVGKKPPDPPTSKGYSYAPIAIVPEDCKVCRHNPGKYRLGEGMWEPI